MSGRRKSEERGGRERGKMVRKGEREGLDRKGGGGVKREGKMRDRRG